MIDDSAAQPPDEATKLNQQWKIQFYVLCGMLLLALIGMGLTQALEKGVWEYWLFVVFVYAALGLWRSTRKAKLLGQPVKQLISRELAHWMILLAFLGVVMLLERKEIIDRQSASDVALMLLAFSCCLAGIHFDWLLMVVGVVLTVMLVALATLEQYTVALWVIMILVVVGAAAYFFLDRRNMIPLSTNLTVPRLTRPFVARLVVPNTETSTAGNQAAWLRQELKESRYGILLRKITLVCGASRHQKNC